MRGGHASRLLAITIVAFMASPLIIGDPNVVGIGPAQAAWSTFRGDARHTGLSAYSVWMGEGGVEWQLPFEFDFISNMGRGNPSIGPDGTVYISQRNSHHIMAVGWNGSLLWIYDTGTSLSDGSAPAISDEGVIHQNAGRSLFALFPNGTLRWRFDCGGDLCSNPVIADDGMIYVGCEDAKLYAIATNGTTGWNFTTNGTVRSSPAVSHDGSIILMARMGTETQLVALSPNGSAWWAVVLPDGQESMSPSIGNDGSVLVYDRHSLLYKFHGNGTLDWTIPIRHGEEGLRARVTNYEVAFGPDGTIYSGSSDGLYALTPEGGIKWMIEEHLGISSPIVSADGTVFVTASDSVWVVDPEGNVLGTYFTKKFSYSSGSPTYMIIGANGTIICTRNEGLFAVSGEPSEWPEDISTPRDGILVLAVVIILVMVFLVAAWITGGQGPRKADG